MAIIRGEPHTTVGLAWGKRRPAIAQTNTAVPTDTAESVNPVASTARTTIVATSSTSTPATEAKTSNAAFFTEATASGRRTIDPLIEYVITEETAAITSILDDINTHPPISEISSLDYQYFPPINHAFTRDSESFHLHTYSQNNSAHFTTPNSVSPSNVLTMLPEVRETQTLDFDNRENLGIWSDAHSEQLEEVPDKVLTKGETANTQPSLETTTNNYLSLSEEIQDRSSLLEGASVFPQETIIANKNNPVALWYSNATNNLYLNRSTVKNNQMSSYVTETADQKIDSNNFHLNPSLSSNSIDQANSVPLSMLMQEQEKANLAVRPPVFFQFLPKSALENNATNPLSQTSASPTANWYDILVNQVAQKLTTALPLSEVEFPYDRPTLRPPVYLRPTTKTQFLPTVSKPLKHNGPSKPDTELENKDSSSHTKLQNLEKTLTGWTSQVSRRPTQIYRRPIDAGLASLLQHWPQVSGQVQLPLTSNGTSRPLFIPMFTTGTPTRTTTTSPTTTSPLIPIKPSPKNEVSEDNRTVPPANFWMGVGREDPLGGGYDLAHSPHMFRSQEDYFLYLQDILSKAAQIENSQQQTATTTRLPPFATRQQDLKPTKVMVPFFPRNTNDTFVYDLDYLASLGGQVAYLVYPDYDYSEEPASPTPSTSAATVPRPSASPTTNMEQLYPFLGLGQTQLQNQSQSVVNEVHSYQNLVIQLTNGTNITVSVQPGGGNVIGGSSNLGPQAGSGSTSGQNTGGAGSGVTGSGDSSTLNGLSGPLDSSGTGSGAISGGGTGNVISSGGTGSGSISGGGSSSGTNTGSNTAGSLTGGTSTSNTGGVAAGGSATGGQSSAGSVDSDSPTIITIGLQGSGTSPTTLLTTTSPSSLGSGAFITRPFLTTAATKPATAPPGSSGFKPAVYRCNERGTESMTNFVNPSYPYRDTSAGICMFRLDIQPGVCQVRVDVIETHLAPPTEGVCVRQYLTVQGTIWRPGVQRICGTNSDTHFYLEVEEDIPSPFVEVAVSSQAGLSYRWGLWLTQLDCHEPSAILAPSGCFQYFTESTGEIKSFSFEDGEYYIDQHYRICLATTPKICSVTFSAQEQQFMIEKYGNIDEVPYDRSGMSSLYCVRDYLRIPDGSADGGAHTSSHDRYCGGRLASTHGAMAPSPVTSRVTSRIVVIEFHAGTPQKYVAKAHGPGFKVNFQHNPCPPQDDWYIQEAEANTRGVRPDVTLPPPLVLKVPSSSTLVSRRGEASNEDSQLLQLPYYRRRVGQQNGGGITRWRPFLIPHKEIDTSNGDQEALPSNANQYANGQRRWASLNGMRFAQRRPNYRRGNAPPKAEENKGQSSLEPQSSQEPETSSPQMPQGAIYSTESPPSGGNLPVFSEVQLPPPAWLSALQSPDGKGVTRPPLPPPPPPRRTTTTPLPALSPQQPDEAALSSRPPPPGYILKHPQDLINHRPQHFMREYSHVSASD
ncbi:location of vulva defective 1-like [Macrobrachium rosenbergii]|uniref:location of vulva defective 1-like n=1 Tax=Macrobrachium rosenbergii TaxID=79674 RepID=UPI0034D56838